METRRPDRRAVAVALVLVLGLSGCTGDDGAPQAAPSPSDIPAPLSPSATEEPTEAPTPEPTEAPTVAARPLADEWYDDANGNEVPDHIEVELGWDPLVDECAEEVDCPGPSAAGAAPTAALEDASTMLVLDASGSMAADAGGGQSRMEAAKDAIERYVTGTPDFVDLGFMVYGHRGSNEPSGKAESCRGAEVLAPLGEVDPSTFGDVLAGFAPTGYTPIATSLLETEREFAGREGKDNRVILVTDGIETCDGDPVAAAQRLAGGGIDVTVDVVGFAVPDAEASQLRDIAAAGGGTYTDVQTGAELRSYFWDQMEVWRGLVFQQLCVQQHANRVVGCYQRRANRAMTKIGLMAAQFYDPGEDAAREALSALVDGIRERVDGEVTRVRATSEQQREAILADVEEAAQRMREVYGETLSSTFVCPGLGVT